MKKERVERRASSLFLTKCTYISSDLEQMDPNPI
jgi:hypothetical protein